MPYLALSPELIQGYDERTWLTSHRMAFSLPGGPAAFVVPLTIIGTLRPENANCVFAMGVIFGIASALPLLLNSFGTRGKAEYASQIPHAAEVDELHSGARPAGMFYALATLL